MILPRKPFQFQNLEEVDVVLNSLSIQKLRFKQFLIENPPKRFVEGRGNWV
jgi:hypothetical protein